MKECSRICDLFVEVQDDHVDIESDKIFREHLYQCATCREEFRWYGVTVKALSNLDRVPPPGDFLEQLKFRLDRVDSPSYMEFFKNLFSSAPYMPLPVGMAALAFVAFFSFVLFNNSITEGLPKFGYDLMAKQTTTAPSAPSLMPGPGTAGAPGYGAWPQDSTPPLSLPSTNQPHYSLATRSSVQSATESTGSVLPTLADRIGADNLTVESASIDSAVESLKKMLPNLQGRVVEMRPSDGSGAIVLGVTIPSGAYADLTSKLINYGAVETGAGSEVTPPKPLEDGRNQVFLYIRFLRSR